MARKRKDTDYLCLSAQLRSLERHLLTAAEQQRMLEAPTVEEAIRVLTERGYEPFAPDSPTGLNRSLLLRREAVFRRLDGSAPESAILDLFRLKYDYHNVKTILKSQGADVSRLLMDAGRIPAAELQEKYRELGSWRFLPPGMAPAAEEARRILAQTADPQQSDLVLDRACYAEMLALAREARCDYLTDYVRARIDAANLRSTVRVLRLHRQDALLRQLLLPGGRVREDSLLSAAQSGGIAAPFSTTVLRQAAVAGEQAVKDGGSLTDFERLCDDALLRQAKTAKRVPFGVEVLIGYLIACEAELTAVRIILSGRMAGLPAAAIRERLRECYV